MALTKSSKLLFMVVFVAAVFLLSSQLAFTASADFIHNPMLGRKLLQDPPRPVYADPSGGSGGYTVPSGGSGGYPCC